MQTPKANSGGGGGGTKRVGACKLRYRAVSQRQGPSHFLAAHAHEYDLSFPCLQASLVLLHFGTACAVSIPFLPPSGDVQLADALGMLEPSRSTQASIRGLEMHSRGESEPPAAVQSPSTPPTTRGCCGVSWVLWARIVLGITIGLVLIGAGLAIWQLVDLHAENHVVAWFVGGVFTMLSVVRSTNWETHVKRAHFPPPLYPAAHHHLRHRTALDALAQREAGLLRAYSGHDHHLRCGKLVCPALQGEHRPGAALHNKLDLP